MPMTPTQGLSENDKQIVAMLGEPPASQSELFALCLAAKKVIDRLLSSPTGAGRETGAQGVTRESLAVKLEQQRGQNFVYLPPEQTDLIVAALRTQQAPASGELIREVLALLNPLHGSLDEQTYDEKHKDGEPHPDNEYSVNVTHKQESDLTKAVLLLEKAAALSASPASTEIEDELTTDVERRVAAFNALRNQALALSCELQFALAIRLAANVGYELKPDRPIEPASTEADVKKMKEALTFIANGKEATVQSFAKRAVQIAREALASPMPGRT